MEIVFKWRFMSCRFLSNEVFDKTIKSCFQSQASVCCFSWMTSWQVDNILAANTETVSWLLHLMNIVSMLFHVSYSVTFTICNYKNLLVLVWIIRRCSDSSSDSFRRGSDKCKMVVKIMLECVQFKSWMG